MGPVCTDVRSCLKWRAGGLRFTFRNRDRVVPRRHGSYRQTLVLPRRHGSYRAYTGPTVQTRVLPRRHWSYRAHTGPTAQTLILPRRHGSYRADTGSISTSSLCGLGHARTVSVGVIPYRTSICKRCHIILIISVFK